MWGSKEELISNVLLHTDVHVLANKRKLNTSLGTRDIVYKTCWKKQMIETYGKRERGRERERGSQGINKSHRDQGLDIRKAEEMSRFPSWSNSLWQGWSCELVHCPAGIATDPIWRVLASSDRISSWTPLKPQHSNPNPNPNPLANQLWSLVFLTRHTPLIIPHRLPAFLESLMPLKNSCSIHARCPKSSTILWHFFQV